MPNPTGALLAGPTERFPVPADTERWLTAAELERANALRHAADRADFVAAHVLARRCAGLVLGAAPGDLRIDQHCPTCGENGHGRPAIAGAPHVHVSLTHTRGYVAAVADTAEIAVDAEHLITREDPARLRNLAESVLTPSELSLFDSATHPEQTFAELWVRKEALIKLGRADLDTLTAIDVSSALGRTGRYADLVVHGWAAGGICGAVVGYRVPEHRDVR